ncbi:Ogfr [Symbiodinium sp. CCMP2592]|nr:Ogfr [Symbiodinium sp. CCMP2592]
MHDSLDAGDAADQATAPTGAQEEIPPGTQEEIPTGTQEEIPTGTQEEIPTGTLQETPTNTPDEAVASQKNMATETQQEIPTGTQEIPTGTQKTPTDTPDEALPAATGTQQEIPTETQEPQIHTIDTQSTVPGLEDSQLLPCMEWSRDIHGTVRDMLFQCPDVPASNIDLLGENLASCVRVIRDHVCLGASLDVGEVTTRLGLENLSEDDASCWGSMFRAFEAQYEAACVLEREVCVAQEQALTVFVKEQQADELKKMLSDHLQKKTLSQASFDSKVKAIEANLKRFYEESQVETNAKVRDAVLHQDGCADALLVMWDKLPVSAKARLPVSLTDKDVFEDPGDDQDLLDIEKAMESFMNDIPGPSSTLAIVKAEPTQPAHADGVVIDLSDEEDRVPEKAPAKATPANPESNAKRSCASKALASKSTIELMEEASIKLEFLSYLLL